MARCCVFRRRRNVTIHPENRQDVQLIRQRSTDSHQGRSAAAHVGRARQDTCPICLVDPSVYTVQTNCGHVFCGETIHRYLNTTFDSPLPFHRKVYRHILEISIELDERNELSSVSTAGRR